MPNGPIQILTVYDTKMLVETWDGFYRKVEEILENYCPLKKIQFRRDKPDWMSNEIIEFIKDRDAALKKAAKSKTMEDKNCKKY